MYDGAHKRLQKPGAHQMELPSPLISWVNAFPSRVISRAIFFRNALESHECAWCLLSFLHFHWLFPLLARETSPGNHSIYKSTRERVDSKGLCERWRLHLMGSRKNLILSMQTWFHKTQTWFRKILVHPCFVSLVVRIIDLFPWFVFPGLSSQITWRYQVGHFHPRTQPFQTS